MEHQDPPHNSNGEGAPRRFRFPWRLVIGLLAIGALAFVARDQFGELGRLLEVKPQYLALMVILFLLARLANAEVLVQTLRTMGHHIARKEALMISFLRSYAGMFIPRAGAGAAGIYLKTKHGVRYADFAALLLPIALVQCVATGGLGLGCLAILSLQYGQGSHPVIAGVFAFSIIAGALALLIRVAVPDDWTGRLAHFARRLSRAWAQLSSSKSLLGRLLSLHLLAMLLRAVRLQVVFWSMGVPVSFVGVLVASLVADLSFLVSFTPNALGIREAAIVFGARAAGATAAEALAAAILDRLVTTVTVIVAAQISLWRMAASKSQKPSNEQPQEAAQES